VGWNDIGELIAVYKQERQQTGHHEMGMLGASRCLIVGHNKEDAAARGHAYVEKTFNNYKRWRMQERTMVELQLDFASGLDAWTIHGSPQDCVETIQQAHEETGVEYIGFTIYSLPVDVQERIDYLQMIAEDIVAKAR
jgi:alkanesulfonate monooxygenase SsuD/methylene tetrahydromethanopterin reductase-like flavin-dependent oxidoreductase (luciferase family)